MSQVAQLGQQRRDESPGLPSSGTLSMAPLGPCPPALPDQGPSLASPMGHCVGLQGHCTRQRQENEEERTLSSRAQSPTAAVWPHLAGQGSPRRLAQEEHSLAVKHLETDSELCC